MPKGTVLSLNENMANYLDPTHVCLSSQIWAISKHLRPEVVVTERNISSALFANIQ